MNSNMHRPELLRRGQNRRHDPAASVGFMLLKRADDEDRATTLTAGEGLSLGFIILGVLRQVAQLGEGE